MAKVTSEIAVLNSCAISLSTNTRRKKSKASSVHPRKIAITTLRCSRVHSINPAMFIPPPEALGVHSDDRLAEIAPLEHTDERFGSLVHTVDIVIPVQHTV